MTKPTSRLAPSPTGALHLGNARTFLVNWALARRHGWTLCMRIEDLDGPRVRGGAAEQAVDTLRWLGIDWDGPMLVQSDDLEPYRRAMRLLAEGAHVYACRLTRREIEASASAPHATDHELRCGAELRPADRRRWRFDDEMTNYRLAVPEESITVDDRFAGRRTFRPCDEVGDFVVWTKRGQPAYQLAVVVDDARQDVTDVVRGDDLLASAARQSLLYERLGLCAPRWWHLPLVLGEDGRRLAKRHGDTRLEAYRRGGTTAQRVVGLLANWCGITGEPLEMTAADFCERFSLDRLSHDPVTFTREHHEWLVQ